MKKGAAVDGSCTGATVTGGCKGAVIKYQRYWIRGNS